MATHLDLEEQEQLDQLRHFWNKWGTLISSILVVVAAAVVAYNGYQYWQNRQAMQAAALFDAVDAAANAGDTSRLDQAFGDLKDKFPSTVQAAQAGLVSAKVAAAAGKLDESKVALTWVAEHGADDGLKAVAKLRLAGVLSEQKQWDEAAKQLAGSVPAEFAATYADRLGDVLMAQGKRTEAAEQYRKAYQAFDENVEYRRLVEIKLNALGVNHKAIAQASSK